MAQKLQIKRGNKAQMPVLAAGEPAFALDEGKLYLGDGVSNIALARGDHSHTAAAVGAAAADHTATVATASALGHIKSGGEVSVAADGALSIRKVDCGAQTTIQLKRSSGTAVPTLLPGEPLMLGGKLYVGDSTGAAVRMARFDEIGATLSSIAITTPPTKTRYVGGERFDPAGMVVTAKYTNGATKVITGGCTWSPETITAAGTVTVSFTEFGLKKSATIPVTVGNPASWDAYDQAVSDCHSANCGIFNDDYYATYQGEMTAADAIIVHQEYFVEKRGTALTGAPLFYIQPALAAALINAPVSMAAFRPHVDAYVNKLISGKLAEVDIRTLISNLKLGTVLVTTAGGKFVLNITMTAAAKDSVSGAANQAVVVVDPSKPFGAYMPCN
ncbi:MAG: bacterial Ig-like domain-containing protein [Oscillospiraceae bacterium]